MSVISIRGKDSLLVKILMGAVFFLAFLSLNKSNLADYFRLELIFRQIVIPLYQWILIFGFAAIWRYTTREPWAKVLRRASVLGLIYCLYLPMLDTLKQAWTGVPLSRIYIIYINTFVFLAASSLILLGTFVIKKAFSKKAALFKPNFFGDAIFFPLSLLSIYGIYFYYLSNHKREAALLLGISIVSLYLFYKKSAFVTKASSYAKGLLARFCSVKALLISIFILALIARVVFFLNLLAIEGPRYPLASDDGDTYDAYGWRGAEDPMIFIRESPHFFWVFYAALLSIIYRIFGHNYLAVGVVQSIIGALFCSLLFSLGYNITKNKTVALLSALFVALDSRLIFLTTTLNTEVLYIPFLTILALFLLFYVESQKDSRAFRFLIFAGFILGLTTIIRTMGIGLLSLILPWILFFGRSYTTGRFAKRLRDAAVFFVLTIATVSPVTYINYLNTNKFYLVYDTGTSVEWRITAAQWGEDIVPSNQRLIELGMKEPINDPIGSIRAILERPIDIIKAFCDIIPKRMRNLWLWPNFGRFDPIFLMNPAQCASRYASHLEFYAISLAMASFPIFLFSNIKIGLKILSSIVIVYYTILHGVFYLSIGPRYGGPMRPFLYIIMAFGLYKIFTLLREKA